MLYSMCVCVCVCVCVSSVPGALVFVAQDLIRVLHLLEALGRLLGTMCVLVCSSTGTQGTS